MRVKWNEESGEFVAIKHDEDDGYEVVQCLRCTNCNKLVDLDDVWIDKYGCPYCSLSCQDA